MTDQASQIYRWNWNCSLSDSHFNLQFVYYFISNFNNILEHSNLLFTSDNIHLSTFQEEVSAVFITTLNVYLSSNLLEKNEVAF